MRSFLLSIALLTQLSAVAQPAQDSLMPWKNYECVGELYHGYRWVGNNGKFGALNAQWKELVPCRYDKYFFIEGAYADVIRNGRHGLADTFGKEVVRCEYDSIHYRHWDYFPGPGHFGS